MLVPIVVCYTLPIFYADTYTQRHPIKTWPSFYENLSKKFTTQYPNSWNTKGIIVINFKGTEKMHRHFQFWYVESQLWLISAGIELIGMGKFGLYNLPTRVTFFVP